VALTKKDLAKIEAYRTLAALRWTGEVKPDIPIPECYQTTTSGWDMIPDATGWGPYATVAWSEPSQYGHGKYVPNQTMGFRGSKPLYSTKLLALKAARHEIEKRFAAQLAKVDAEIEKEEAGAQAPD
jgi:hypothetical protein